MFYETKWTVIDTEETLETALGQCRGGYQKDVVRGREAWSGSTLQGAAKNYSGKYSMSRGRLRARLESAGLHVEIRRVDRRNVLVITAG